jgi:5'-nucleotidase
MSKDKKDRLIFVTNDDGYSAAGFEAAIEVARSFGRVFAVAPATVQSGRSQAITMYEPLFLETQRCEEDVEIYSFSGTPTDCVKVAFNHLLKDQKVDLVISGINHGSNSAINVLYSGTMGAAIEGSFYGCPSVGLSLTDHAADADFTAAKRYAREIIAALLEGEQKFDRPLCLNVNIPNIAEQDIRGVRVCRQCRGIWREEFFRHEDPRGKPYFWLTGSYTNYEPDAQDTDEWALANGYVSVVPVQVDMTGYHQLEQLKDILR